MSIPITWTDLVNTTSGVNSLTKTSGVDGNWDAGAASNEVLLGDGKVEFKSLQTNKYLFFGLSNVNLDEGYTNIEYAIFLQPTPNVQIRENGVFIADFGSYTTSDIFSIERIRNKIFYKKNDITFYVSTVNTTETLIADISIAGSGAGFSDYAITNYPALEDVVWTDKVNVTATTNSLEKTNGSVAWDAGAFSIQGFDGNGRAEFIALETDKHRMFGLSYVNNGVNFNTIDYALYILNANQLLIYESGYNQGSVYTYATGDILSVERIGTTVYYKKNGSVVYTSTVSSSGTLYADTSFYSLNSTISEAKITVTPEISIDETINLSDSWNLQTNPDNQIVTEILTLSDSWQVITNPEQENITENLNLSDTWNLQTNPEQEVINETVTLSDDWLIDRTGTFTTNFLTKLYTVVSIFNQFHTDLRLSSISLQKFSTKLYLKLATQPIYKTDLRVTTPISPQPKSLDNFLVKKDGVTLLDVDYNSLNITLALNINPSTARFILPRRHDKINYMLDGTLSIITAENKIEVFDGTIKLFTGYISEIEANSQDDTVHVTASDARAKMAKTSYRLEYGGAWRVDADHDNIPDDDINATPDSIAWNAPSYIKFEKNILNAFIEVMGEVGILVSGYENLPFAGSYVPEYVATENNLTSLIDDLIRQTANCNWYIDENEFLRFQTVGTGASKILNLASLNIQRGLYDLVISDIRLNTIPSNYAKSLKVKLGKNTTQLWQRKEFFGLGNRTFDNFMKSLDEKTTFIFHQTGEHVYPNIDDDASGNGGYPTGAFYTGMNGTAIQYWTYGVFLSYPVIVVQWLDKHSPLNKISNISDITVGSGLPSKNFYLTSYGVKNSNIKWGEEVRIFQNPNSNVIHSLLPTTDQNYLTYFQDETYDHTTFARDLASFELSQSNKLETSANLSLLLDAYEYYSLSFKDLINLGNTIQENIYNNSNGFPLNIESINIDCSKRLVTMNLTNHGKSWYAKTKSVMTGYTPAFTQYIARKVIWKVVTNTGEVLTTE